MVSLPRFGVTRPVPVRLLMTAVLVAGVYAALTLRREFFPEIDPEAALVSIVYPGATPLEIEESVVRKVEDALADLEEVDEIRTTISEGGASVLVEFHSGVDVSEGRDEVERAVDLLTDLPEELEEIRIVEFEPTLPAIMVTLHGAADEDLMKRAIRQVADDLRMLPGMGEILVSGVRDYELVVDVREAALLEHSMSLPQVSDAIRAWMAETPGGAVRTGTGTINVRALAVPEQAEAVRRIVVKATPEGQSLRVGDLATVSEGFVDEPLIRRFNGRPAVSLTVFKRADQDAIDIAQMVRAYVAGCRGERFSATWRDRLPGSSRRRAWDLGAARAGTLPGEIATHSELARFIEGRLQLLTENARQGAVLIFLTIFLILGLRPAWWVMTGLVTAICGTLLLMSVFDVTLNLLTMFGLLITLGMLEDDAIVVSENIVARHEAGEPPLAAAVKGAEQVFWPVVGTVLTTIVAFLPLTFVQGRIGDLLGALPWVVLFSLLVSVIETMTILPSHMAHSLERARRRRPNPVRRVLERYERWRDGRLMPRVIDGYARFLAVSMEHRYISAAVALATLVISLGMVAGGRVEFVFLPKTDSETITIDVRMPVGTALAQTAGIVNRIEEAAEAQPETRSVSSIVGQQVDVDTGLDLGTATHLAQMFVELVPVEARDRESSQVIGAIRAALGPVDEAESVRFSEIGGAGSGADITVRVIGDEVAVVDAATAEVKAALAGFDGVHDVADDNYDSQRELQVELRPGAAALGFTAASVARQLRGAIHGLEPHVFSAQREDIDVRVRLEEASRRNLATIDRLWVVGPHGRSVPLSEIAELRDGRGYASIRRIDRRRTVTVTADTSPGTNPERVVEALLPRLDRIRHDHPGATIELAGRQRDLAEAFQTLPLAFAAALLMIYLILAWLFSSYVQPLAVMIAIPFGVIGVVWGHLLLGFQLTFLSLIGFVALTGVVVNNSLILIDVFNARRAEGLALRPALVAAGRARLRAITLTSVTTFLGLTPLILEQSFQARFLIPMAISISFGLLSATVLTLAVLPCILVIIDDLKAGGYFLWHGVPRPLGRGSPGARETTDTA